MDLTQISIAGFSALVIIMALVGATKALLPRLDSRFSPILALVFGVLLMVGNATSAHFGGYTAEVFEAILTGIALGGAAVGVHTGYSAVKTYSNSSNAVPVLGSDAFKELDNPGAMVSAIRAFVDALDPPSANRFHR